MLIFIYENDCMESFLQWYTENNKIIIQILLASVGATLIYFFYRLFILGKDEISDFLVNSAEQKNKAADNLELQSESKSETVVSAKTTEKNETLTTEKSTAEMNEIEFQLSEALQKIKDQQVELFSWHQLQDERKNSLATIDTSQLTGDTQLISKIDDLQKKLSEYQIIADDIAELQDLRKENELLKAKIS